jgi:hypothetical protein
MERVKKHRFVSIASVIFFLLVGYCFDCLGDLFFIGRIHHWHRKNRG